jgi:AbiV family abortive infection protein
MFAREELGRHYVLLEKWKAATGSLPTVREINKACNDHSEKQQRAQLSIVYVGDRDSEIGKASVAQSENPPGSLKFEAAEQVITAWLTREKENAPGERHQARMTSLYVDVRDDGCGWNRPCEIGNNIAYQTVNHAMNDYRLRRGNLLTHEILRIKDPELSTALQAWGDKPELVHLPHLPMDSEDIYRG